MAWLIGFVFSLFLLSFLLLRRMNRRPGAPVNWPLVGMLPSLVTNSQRFHDYVATLLRETGGNFPFQGPAGMETLLTADPANVNYILNRNFDNYRKGEGFYETMDIFGEGIIGVDGERWRTQRRMAVSVVASQRFQALATKCAFDKVVNGLVPLLSLMAERGKAFDLYDLMMSFIFDTTSILFLGVDPGSVGPDISSVKAKAMEEVEQGVFFRYLVPRFWWKLQRRLGVGTERRLAEALGVMDCFIADTIADKRREMKKRAGAGGGTELELDLLTSYMERDGETPSSDKFLRDTALTFMAAGKDTTASAISWFLWLVSINPHAEERILAELREMPSLSVEGIGRLVYLHAALCETLRLYPSVPLNHKAVVEDDSLPSGCRVRKGSKVLISMYAMGRMVSVWGEDCFEFKPERWIGDDGKVRHEPSCKFSAFGSGLRNCLGKDMAISKIKVVTALVLYHFRVRVAAGGHRVEPKVSAVLGMKKGMQVHVTKRIHGGG